MVNAIKKALRITHSNLDDAVSAAISAALLDMSRVGIKTGNIDIANSDTCDALELKAVEFYCKFVFNYQGNAELWEKAYEKLRDSMSLCGDYNGGRFDG